MNKCAEVFCQSFENYEIVCVDCDLKTSSFDEFILHYQNVHCAVQPKIKAEVEIDLQLETEIKIERCEFEDEHELAEQQMPDLDAAEPIDSTHETNPLAETKVACPICKKWYSSKKSLSRHMRLHSSESKTKVISQTQNEDQLTDDGSLTNNINDLNDQTETINQSIVGEKTADDSSATESSDADDDAEKFIEHKQKTHKKQLDCPKCDKKYFCKKSFRSHLRLNHPGFEFPRLFACSKCPAEYFGTRKALCDHKSEKHTIKEDNGNFLCPYCAKQYTKRTSLVGHIRSAHKKPGAETKNFPCTQCDRVFNARFKLTRHEIRHTGERNCICPEPNCGLAFFDSKTLNAHRRHMHIGLKKFVCEICGFKTKTPNTLRTHIRTHTNEKPFKCDQCDKWFTTSSAVVEHKAIHNSNVRPYVCEVCGKAFSRPKALYHHKPLHLGIKKFVCKICGKAYAQLAGLSAHKRQHALESTEVEKK